MAKLLLLFSHTLTKEQIKEARDKFGCDELCYLPDHLQQKWSNVNPEGRLPASLGKEFIDYLKENSEKKDYVLIQGDFGLTCFLVKWCFKNNLIPIYATTRRESKQKISKDSILTARKFKHVNFREYTNE